MHLLPIEALVNYSRLRDRFKAIGSVAYKHPRRYPDKTASELKEMYDQGAWNSSLVSSYHMHYDVNCSAIIRGDVKSIQMAKQIIMDKASVSGTNTLATPSDEIVTSWTDDCHRYKVDRKYPTSPASQEEAAYPVAYIIVVHKDAAQVERLLRNIYHPQNLYCIHPDTGAPDHFQKAIRALVRCFDNVFIATTLERIQYRGYTRLQADINCMHDLSARKSHGWKYVINLCGQDFPLKTNLEIIRQLKAYNGYSDIPGVYPEQNELFISRTRNHHMIIDGKVKKTNVTKPPPPHNVKVYFGNAYYVAVRSFVEYILTNGTAQDVLHYLMDTNSPDEHFWVTMSRYPGAPGGYPKSSWVSNARFIRWTTSVEYPPCVGKYVRQVCVISLGYLPYIATIPQLFVNKVHYGYDPVVIQCLEDLLDYRTANPESTADFIAKFPLSNLFP
ncbi:N-acetyllactosaminide beta-1,6-N-acetylglucosaminyl-transferase-like [Diadema setosum]|uniref:N-acetyllactosaminide beta-1,6-N-acetylglucosaminyl-transferase-like n=1 Tax=Diadema setosum TaxID=31175 RepID=UPI003B3A405D